MTYGCNSCGHQCFVWSQLAPVMMARRKMLGEDAVNDRQIKAFQVVMERAITVMEKYNWADYMKQQPGSAPTCQILLPMLLKRKKKTLTLCGIMVFIYTQCILSLKCTKK